MNITELLENEHSSQSATKIASYVKSHPSGLQELMNCFLSDQYRLCQRASWPLAKLGDSAPEIILPYLPQMLRHIEKPVHDAAIRNTVRLLQNIEIPKELTGEIYQKCFHYLTSMQYAIAIKVFSMSVLTRIALRYQELIPELILAIEEQVPHGSAGFQNRAKKELKKLHENRLLEE